YPFSLLGHYRNSEHYTWFAEDIAAATSHISSAGRRLTITTDTISRDKTISFAEMPSTSQDHHNADRATSHTSTPLPPKQQVSPCFLTVKTFVTNQSSHTMEEEVGHLFERRTLCERPKPLQILSEVMAVEAGEDI